MEETTYNGIIEKLQPFKNKKVRMVAVNVWDVDENYNHPGNEMHQIVRFFDEYGDFLLGIRQRYNKETLETIEVKFFEQDEKNSF